jgi:hypothetical protein
MKQQTEDSPMRRIAGAALALCITFAASAADDVIRKGFNVSQGGTLRLDGAYGAIKVVTGGTGVAIEITREAHGNKAEQRMASHKISFSQQGNDVVIDSKLDDDRNSGWFNWRDDDDYEVQWNIRVPARYNVQVETSAGSIDLANIGGTVDARTSGGSIKTGRLAGVSTLKTSGGSISVDGADAKLDVHTSGGSISIGDTKGPVEAKTSGGSITLARIDGDVVARTSGGNIRIEDGRRVHLGRLDQRTHLTPAARRLEAFDVRRNGDGVARALDPRRPRRARQRRRRALRRAGDGRRHAGRRRDPRPDQRRRPQAHPPHLGRRRAGAAAVRMRERRARRRPPTRGAG